MYILATHINLLRADANLQRRFRAATSSELEDLADCCAICRYISPFIYIYIYTSIYTGHPHQLPKGRRQFTAQLSRRDGHWALGAGRLLRFFVGIYINPCVYVFIYVKRINFLRADVLTRSTCRLLRHMQVWPDVGVHPKAACWLATKICGQQTQSWGRNTGGGPLPQHPDTTSITIIVWRESRSSPYCQRTLWPFLSFSLLKVLCRYSVIAIGKLALLRYLS